MLRIKHYLGPLASLGRPGIAIRVFVILLALKWQANHRQGVAIDREGLVEREICTHQHGFGACAGPCSVWIGDKPSIKVTLARMIRFHSISLQKRPELIPRVSTGAA